MNRGNTKIMRLTFYRQTLNLFLSTPNLLTKEPEAMTRVKLLTAGIALFAAFGAMLPHEGYADVTVQPTQQSQNASPQPMTSMSVSLPTDQVHVVQDALERSGLERGTDNNGIPDGQFGPSAAQMASPFGEFGRGGKWGQPTGSQPQQPVIYQMAQPDTDTMLYGVAPPPREFHNVDRPQEQN